MKNFCLDLGGHATKIINYEKKEMIPLTKKKRKNITNKKFVIYVKKDLVLMITTKNIIRLEIIATILENIDVLIMIFATKDIKYQKKFQ